MPSLAESIAAAVRVRERGDPLHAASLLLDLEQQALKKRRYATVAQALAQRIVCEQLLSNNGQDRVRLENMKLLGAAGLGLAWTRIQAASYARIFEYRLGIACLRLKEIAAAVMYFTNALRGLEPGDDQFPEFHSYLGLTNVHRGQTNLGITQIQEASVLLEQVEPPDPVSLDETTGKRNKNLGQRETWLIRYTGVLLRLIEADIILGKPDDAQVVVEHVLPQIVELRDQYQNIWRWRDYQHIEDMLQRAQG